MKKYIVGIDVGTTGTKTIIFDLKGRIVGSGYKEYSCYYPKPNWVEQDVNEMIDALFETNRQALKNSGINPSEIASIAASTQRGCCVFVDYNDKPLKMISWQDNRTTDEVMMIDQKIGNDKYYKITGMPNACTWILQKVLYIRDKEPKIWKQTKKHTQLQDVVLKALGADDYYSDEAGIAISGLWDTDNFCWSKEIIDTFEIDKDKLAKVLPSGTCIGGISKEAAEKSGFLEGTPICVGIGDQNSAAVGAGVVYPGMLSVSIGTGGMAVAFLENKYRDPKGKTIICNHALHGYWQFEGLQNGAAGVYRWFRDEVAALEKERAQINGTDVFVDLEKKIKKIPAGCDGLLCMPYWAAAASPRWNTNARGAFLGLTFSHTRMHMARSCIEGITLEQKDIINSIRENNIKVDKVRIIGGATKSETWNQIQADCYNLPTETLHVKDAGSLGSAMCGAVGVGIYKDIREAADDLVKFDKRYEPVPENVKVYEELFGIYRDIYESLDKNGIYKRLSDLQK
ncbi:MAG: FGGY family carbohydrate kinase [Actinobacteria bacterium]|nr:FGGY family carbohydrate kinase [Actinomycetota bacterium]